ncbi:MAG: ABC transporter permease [Spirochaetia bacterium]|jgi:ribose transport system permease protein
MNKNAPAWARKRNGNRDLLMPVISLLVVFLPIVILRPRVFSYTGLQLLLNMAIPISLVTVGQMFAMSIGEIDFSLGNLVSLVTCIVGTVIPRNPPFGIALLLAIFVIYMIIGAFLSLRKVPSIVVTIGMSFVWMGAAVIIQPSPGGSVPLFLQKAFALLPPFLPLPVIFMVVLAVVVHLIVFRTTFGVLVRGVGGNLKAVQLSGHSVLRVQVIVFSLVGLFGILGGIALASITTSADANIAGNYTLLAVAGVILGGGSFAGGKVSAAGAVLGACTMTMVGTLLAFLRISTDWQIGAQGFMILVVLFLNVITNRTGKETYV